MNVAEIKSQIRSETAIPDAGAWQSSAPESVLRRPGVQRIFYSTTVITGGIGVDTIVPIYVLDLGGGGETAWYCGDLTPGETDEQKFRRLVKEWCAVRVVAGWFITISHWGLECALGWGINELAAVQMAKFIWENSEKLAITPVLGVPVPGAPEVV
jgi:hypothetical protein